MIELFTPLLSSIIGIGGAFLQRKHERKMFELTTTRIQVEHAHEKELTALQMQAKREETEQEIALTELGGNIEAFTKSQEAENMLSSIQWGKSKLGDFANFLRAATRPLITWYLVIATSIRTHDYYTLTKKAAGLNGVEALPPEVMTAAYDQMMSNPFDLSLVNLTALVVGWWFGSRGSSTSYADAHYRRGSA